MRASSAPQVRAKRASLSPKTERSGIPFSSDDAEFLQHASPASLEDTAFYLDGGLPSRNEGGDPRVGPIETRSQPTLSPSVSSLA